VIRIITLRASAKSSYGLALDRCYPLGPQSLPAEYALLEYTTSSRGKVRRIASIKLQRDALDRSHDEVADLASRVIELSQTLRQQWLTADYDAKRRILEIVCCHWAL
jgi:hypothetical protein